MCSELWATVMHIYLRSDHAFYHNIKTQVFEKLSARTKWKEFVEASGLNIIRINSVPALCQISSTCSANDAMTSAALCQNSLHSCGCSRVTGEEISMKLVLSLSHCYLGSLSKDWRQQFLSSNFSIACCKNKIWESIHQKDLLSIYESLSLQYHIKGNSLVVVINLNWG